MADPLWYKDAIIYQLHVKAFLDSNADGIGDFRGLTEKLDYLQDLGVTALWLLPMYPSPFKDDGYDISDYLECSPRLRHAGRLSDLFRRSASPRAASHHELVVNHTSDQHPWFQEARRNPSSPYHDYYVWSDTHKKYDGTRIIFTELSARTGHGTRM